MFSFKNEDELNKSIRLKTNSIIYNIIYALLMIKLLFDWDSAGKMNTFTLIVFETLILGRFLLVLYYRRKMVGNQDPKYAPSFMRVIVFSIVMCVIVANIIIYLTLGG